jgi:hypothetical protein
MNLFQVGKKNGNKKAQSKMGFIKTKSIPD